MSAPIIRKIPGLHKRIVGLPVGSDPAGTNGPTFSKSTHQNIRKHLQEGIQGLSIGHDFIVATPDVGDELLSNRTFTGNANGWFHTRNSPGPVTSTSNNYAYSNNAVNSTAAQYAHLYQKNVVPQSHNSDGSYATYRVSITISNYVGDVAPTIYVISGEIGDFVRMKGTFTIPTAGNELLKQM